MNSCLSLFTCLPSACLPSAQAGTGRRFTLQFVTRNSKYGSFRSAKEAIWDALWNRRCYATQGQRTLLNFALDEYPIGSVISAEEAEQFAERRRFRYRVQGHRPVVRVELARSDGEVLDLTGAQSPGRETITATFEDDTPLAQVQSAGNAVFYYLRVTESDGRMAWASPIWLQTPRLILV